MIIECYILSMNICCLCCQSVLASTVGEEKSTLISRETISLIFFLMTSEKGLTFPAFPTVSHCHFFFAVDIPDGKLSVKMLDSKNVYILDCQSEIFVW